MPQYTFDDGFYHASRARDIAVGGGAANSVVLSEINYLQVAIDSAARAGEMEATVGQTPETIMTTEKVYYDAWADLYSAAKLDPSQASALRAAAIEMDRVIAYFTRLGYSIERVRGGTIASPPTIGTADRIQWIIKW
jgi:hypothetical protein